MISAGSMKLKSVESCEVVTITINHRLVLLYFYPKCANVARQFVGDTVCCGVVSVV